MYKYGVIRGLHFVLNENNILVATVPVEKDAKEIVAALNLIDIAAARFPGLVNGREEVSGGDLVETFNDYICWDERGERFFSPERGEAGSTSTR